MSIAESDPPGWPEPALVIMRRMVQRNSRAVPASAAASNSRVIVVKQYLGSLLTLAKIERLAPLRQRQLVRDQGREVELALIQHPNQAIPGLQRISKRPKHAELFVENLV